MRRCALLHRLFSSLALLATLLLLGVPTAGRLLGEADHAEMPRLQAVCAMSGLHDAQLQWPAATTHGSATWPGAQPMQALQLKVAAVDAHPGAAHGDRDADERQGGHDAHMDCDYCPLLLSLLAFAALLLLALPVVLLLRMPAARAWSRWPEPYPCGLGSRGPPRLMA